MAGTTVFWIHRFYRWEGVHFDENTDLSPVWIQYLDRPNHVPTKLLTPTLKQKAWDEDPDSNDIEW